MKQPKIKISGQVYKVIQIEFDNKNGNIDKIVYQVSKHNYKTIFRSNEMLSTSLTSKYKIQEPTCHPYHNYLYAPELESLLIEKK